MAYDSVFKRVEKKYRIDAVQRSAMEAAARNGGGLGPDRFGRSRITSLYLDTPGRAMIARSVEKPLYKEKLRLRTYGEAAGVVLMAAFGAGPVVREAGGVPLADDEVEARVRAAAAAVGDAAAAFDLLTVPVFFGIKKKFKGIVYKRRLALTLPAALAFVSGLPYEQACARWPLADPALVAAALAPATRQIARELTAAMDRWLPLAPSMGIACDRVAWAPAPSNESAALDPGLRLTFDDRLAYRNCHGLAQDWEPIIAPTESILEIKSAGPYPPWLVEALSAHAIYPVPFTKYGNAYQLCEGTALQAALAVS